jgi:hypothetical protein
VVAAGEEGRDEAEVAVGVVGQRATVVSRGNGPTEVQEILDFGFWITERMCGGEA